MAKKEKKEEKKKPSVNVWKREQGWDKLDKAELAKLDAYCDEYIDYISNAKTERLAHDIALKMAVKQGFKNFDDLVKAGSMQAAKEKGLIRSEGKDYVMRDGDIVLFRFNVSK